MSAPAIVVEGIGKRYRIAGQPNAHRTLRDSLAEAAARPVRALESLMRLNGNSHRPQPEHIWALRGVSFQIQAGEAVGFIGRNGAGKSTLLKILARITEPTEGSAEIHGRVGSLLEVGTGFHPELTGRENIQLNGAILGMRRGEITQKFDEIVAFAEVEKFIDTPIKHYSSGMYLRLAFAVAAYLDPEILLVDEVLAVGDAEFQRKCVGKMSEVARQGRTVLFVSHNMEAVKRLCGRALWLDRGGLAESGPSATVIYNYLASGSSRSAGEFAPLRAGTRAADAKARLTRARLTGEQGEVISTVASDAPFHVEIEWEMIAPREKVRVAFRVITVEGVVVFSSTDTDPHGWGVPREQGVYLSRCTVPGNFLNTGQYYLMVAADIPTREILFQFDNILPFSVQCTGGVGAEVPDGRLGVIRPMLEWTVSPVESPCCDHIHEAVR